jgi:hypothetical protein
MFCVGSLDSYGQIFFSCNLTCFLYIYIFGSMENLFLFLNLLLGGTSHAGEVNGRHDL